MKNLPDMSATFIYDGKRRQVENITVEPDTNTFIGMEVRKAGKFSNRIKRYSLDKADDIVIGQKGD